VTISAVTGEGLDELLEAIWRDIAAARVVSTEVEPETVDEGIDLITPARVRHDA
jgi:translation initiation factor IF-2